MIGISIAVLNRTQMLIECLESIKYSTHKDYKIYICYDGSTNDLIPKIAKKFGYEKIKFAQFENLKGVGKSKYKAVKLALEDGVDAVQMVDSDDKIHPELLSKMYKKLKDGFDFVNCYGRAFGLHSYPLLSFDKPTFEMMTQKNWLTSWGMFSADTLRKENFNPELISCEDYELYLRLIRKGYKQGVVSEFLYYYRCHENQLSELQKKDMDKNIEKILELNGVKRI